LQCGDTHAARPVALLYLYQYIVLLSGQSSYSKRGGPPDVAKIVFAILGVAATLERRHILERTKRGRAAAKAKGFKFGRKPKLTAHQRREARERIEAGETQRSVARSYNVSQATISRLTV
jgi:DNA invertase Pin-like site-specific DNA recombinase